MSSIIDKVKALLALSKSSNAGEAANAAAAANRLIDQYRLSQAEIDSHSSIDSSEPLEEDSEYLYETGKVTQWKNSLMHALVNHYGCAVWNDTSYATGRKTSRYKLVGTRSDIGIVKYMFAYLTSECSRLSNQEAKGKGRVFIASYCMGFVNGINSQLKASRLEVQTNASGAAIIKMNERGKQALDFMNKNHNLVVKRSSSHSQINSQAFDLGKVKGSNLHLGAKIANSSGHKLFKQ